MFAKLTLFCVHMEMHARMDWNACKNGMAFLCS